MLPLQGGRLLCGTCGQELRADYGPEIPRDVEAIAKQLLQSRCFHMTDKVSTVSGTEPGQAPLHGLTMRRNSHFTEKDQWACTIQWRSVYQRSHKNEIHRSRSYVRACVPGHLPEMLHRTAEIITNSDFCGSGVMFLTEVSVHKPTRFLRFERHVRTNSSKEHWSGLLIRCEVSWTMPEAEAIMFIPVYTAEEAMYLLQNAASGISLDVLPKLQLCFNRYTGEAAAQANSIEGERSAFLLRVRCNPLTLGAALVDDGQLALAKAPGARYASLQDWWTRVSIGSEWSLVGRSVVSALRGLDKGCFSLEHLLLR